MKLKKLIKDLEIEVFSGSKEIEIGGLCSHSKKVCPKDLFIALQGLQNNGADFIQEAIHTGAIAILSSEANPFLRGVTTQLIHPDVASLVAILASRFYDNPSHELFTVGITGTNGKTTISYLVQHLLEKFSFPTGLIGTVEYIIGNHRYPSERTTPDPITLQKLLREMIKNKCYGVVLEVSSHGLAQKRTEKVDFDVAIFTNLTQDHLDYHHSMEEYFEQKMKLFSPLSPSKWAIINISSPYGKQLLKKTRAQIFSYGMESESDLYPKKICLYPDKTTFIVCYKQEEVFFEVPLIGTFNILNVLAATAVLLTKGIALKEIAQKLRDFPPVPGRLEKIQNGKKIHTFVDYAHTPDALENVCKTLKEIAKGKLILVFGCGGDRDRDKRNKMGISAEKFADILYITSDNPRSEDPQKICDEITKEINPEKYQVILDRKEAIAKAIDRASENDLILIAGKGHETYQVFSHQTVPFDDRMVVQQLTKK